MALNTFKCNCLTPLHCKGLILAVTSPGPVQWRLCRHRRRLGRQITFGRSELLLSRTKGRLARYIVTLWYNNLRPFYPNVTTLRSGLCCRQSVCRRLSVTLVHHTQGLNISAIFLHRCVRWPSSDLGTKFYGDRPRGTPPSEALNARGVAKYNDFGPVDDNVSHKRYKIDIQFLLKTK